MTRPSVVVIGGGAAGFFGAIAAAEKVGPGKVVVLERGPQFLSKVRISGGGRCNVTHALFDPRAFTTRYPRGGRALIGAFHRFSATDTVQWFESRGVKLKTEADGRMFPTTDSSQTIIDCLLRTARENGVELRPNTGVTRIGILENGVFAIDLSNGTKLNADRVLLATGGCRAAAAGELAVQLGHTLEPPVPSLFTFHIEDPRLTGLSGLSVERATVSVPGTKLSETGPMLVTHWGLSGPAVLRLSAWGARELHALDYKFTLRVNWLGDETTDDVIAKLKAQRDVAGAKRVSGFSPVAVPNRLWERCTAAAGIPTIAQWASVSREQFQTLARQLTAAEFAVTGKSLNKDEFVTAGGVKLNEVDFRTMESRVRPGLHFAGELLDVDGITGGFNFQAAWTTGWIAGHAMADALSS